jgi:cytochrome c
MAAACVAVSAWADDSARSGLRVYERHCRTCHGGSSPADLPIGPSLAGIVGARAGTQGGGMHSRAVMESGIVWNRESLRAFLSEPRGILPQAMMPTGIADPDELERLLDFLETLR